MMSQKDIITGKENWQLLAAFPNVVEQDDLQNRYQIYSAPSLLIFDEGELIGRHAGMVNAQKFLREGGLLNLVVGRSDF